MWCGVQKDDIQDINKMEEDPNIFDINWVHDKLK